MNVKRSVSIAIHEAGRATYADGPPRILLVQRPDDDEDLPGVWGLPAASLGPHEEWEAAARRAGREKLGVELGDIVLLETGSLDRAGYTLDMRLYAATLAVGEPHVPQDAAGVTQYRAWRWGSAAQLEPAAADGSLCSRLYLSWVMRSR